MLAYHSALHVLIENIRERSYLLGVVINMI